MTMLSAITRGDVLITRCSVVHRMTFAASVMGVSAGSVVKTHVSLDWVKGGLVSVR